MPHKVARRTSIIRTQGDQDQPDAVSDYNRQQFEIWNLVEALRDGTDAMRAQGTEFLPKETKETKTKYKNRLKRSFLFNAYDEAVSSIASKPFSKEVVIVGDEFNEFIEKIKDDADKEGRNITQLAHDLYDSGIDFGMVSILTDFSCNMDEEGNPLSLGGERDEDIRPCFILVPRPNILGFREDPNKPGRLIQLRVFDQRTDEEGKFGEDTIDMIRVYEPDSWEIWERVANSANEWSMVKDGTNTLGEIPLTNIYFKRKGFMQADPSMGSLAWLNLQHYQSSSDQNNILRFARTGTYFGAGFSADEIKTSLIIGVDNMVKAKNPDASLTVVEFQGHAIEAGSADLKQIEDRMEMLGAQPLLQPSNLATGVVINDKKTTTFAQSWVRATSAGLVKAYEWAAKWYGIDELPEDFAVKIFEDFTASIQSDKTMDQVFSAKDMGILTKKTTLEEMQRRDIISADIDIEKELEDAEGEIDKGLGLGQFGDDQEFDEEGNPIEKPELDEDGNPIVKPELDEDGNPIEE